LDPLLGENIPFATYFPAVAVVALYGGLMPAIVTTLAGGLIADLLYMEPRGALVLERQDQWVALFLYCFSAIIILAMAHKLRLSKTDLETQSDRLREIDRQKDSFLAMLAHELRNPLTPILTAAEVMRLRAQDADSALLASARIIERQAKHMKSLIDELLDVSRINTGRIVLDLKHVDLTEVIRHSAESTATRYRSNGTRLDTEGLNVPLWVHADPRRLRQITDNLLDNAFKYTPAGGSVRLSVRRESGHALVSVRDTGVGIAASDLPKLFEPFQQIGHGWASQRQDGLGLGLHLVKRLVEKHRGTVLASSEGEGRGSEFTVRLPLAADQTPELAPREHQMKIAESKRVLVVDDNEDIAASVSSLLKNLGHNVVTATNGRQAITIAEAFQPEVAFVDLRMPQIDGFEVARKLRQKFASRVRLVALTGYSQERFRKQADSAGFDHYLVKPVSQESINEALSLPAQQHATLVSLPGS
jgi:signal transduction histidine kinase/CheY-like chemotaxis protein